MTHDEMRIIPVETLAAGDAEAIDYLQKAVAGGTHWYLALLGAVGLWVSAEEKYNDRTYVYLIDGEAFDWLLLAERLLDTINGMVPEKERDGLLFNGIPPLQLDNAGVKELMGDKKFGMYLNYFYGVTVEEALQLAVQEEVDKDRHVEGLGRYGDYSGETWRRIYDADKDTLFEQFRTEKLLARRASITLDEMKRFSYWLFKYRLRRCEKARIASDTKKALDYLKRIWRHKGVSGVLGFEISPSLPEQ